MVPPGMNLREVTVGRNPRCDIRLDDRCQFASNMHGTIYFDGNQLTFRDNSTNGTMVNNVLVHRRAVPIQHGDSIMIAGKYPLNWNQIDAYFPPLQAAAPVVQRFEPPVSGTTMMQSPVSAVALDPNLSRWNWGAFGINGIWGLFNGCWWMFLINLALWFLMAIPGANIVALVLNVPYIIFCGLKGTSLAWNNKQWTSVEQFEKVQGRWGIAGIIVLALSVFSNILVYA